MARQFQGVESMTSIHALPASLIGKMENDWKYDTPSDLIRNWPFVNVPTFDDNTNPYCAAVISEKTLNYLNTTDNPQGFKGTDDESRFLNARYYEIKPVDIDTFKSFDTDEGIWKPILVPNTNTMKWEAVSRISLCTNDDGLLFSQTIRIESGKNRRGFQQSFACC